jgi:lipopolysaccharide export system protein LptC
MKARADFLAPRQGVPPPRIARRYSRFVHLAKLALPATAAALLLLVAAWPRLDAAFESVHFAIPRIDLSEARDLRMVKARYSGIDRQNRPFTITAEVAREKPKLENLVTLEQPKGNLTETSGNWIQLNADSGLYQPQPQLLDLFGNVAIFQDRGNEFHSSTAGTAMGDDPVTGQGPFGDVTAQGFRILDHGSTIVFTGHAHLDLEPRGAASDK